MNEIKMILYRPSSGTESIEFMEKFCYRCKHYKDFGTHEDCELGILMAAEFYEIGEPEYPDNWQYIDGKPKCTEFEKK